MDLKTNYRLVQMHLANLETGFFETENLLEHAKCFMLCLKPSSVA